MIRASAASVPSVLVIDDEPDNFDVIEALLSDQPYEFHYASSGEEAIAALDAFQPDIILLDVMMPGLDGLEVCRQIKAMPEWRAVPIIMVTALNSRQDLAQCLKTGADDFIGKPLNSVELRARINSMLRIKRQYDTLQKNIDIQTNTINVLENSLQELRGNLATIFPHELNTPLHGVLTSLDLLMTDLDEMSKDDIRELLTISFQSACRMETLIQRFLNYLSLTLGTTRSSYQEQSSSTRITSMVEGYAQQVNRQGDLTCQVEAVELAIAPHHLDWIIREVIDNAFKFSSFGQSVTVQGCPVQDDCVPLMFQLIVKNEGRGMTEEQIQSIGPFMQFERTAYEQRGTGLGLEIAHRTVHLYGGNITLSSVYQKETATTITLPLEKP